jgi:hypothetical protein
VRELRPGLWRWEARHPEWRPTEPWSENVSSYAIDDGERLLLFARRSTCAVALTMIDDRASRTFDEQGYVVARGLLDSDETGFLRDHFTRLREAGAYPGDVIGVDPGSDDPLRKYPRMIHMHRWDAIATSRGTPTKLRTGITPCFGWTGARCS